MRKVNEDKFVLSPGLRANRKLEVLGLDMSGNPTYRDLRDVGSNTPRAPIDKFRSVRKFVH